MPTLLEEIIGQLNPEVAPVLQQKLEVESSVSAQILPMVAPLVLSGLKRMLAGDAGESAVGELLDRDGDDQELDNIPAAIDRRGSTAGSESLLSTLLGQSGDSAIQALSDNLGLSQGQSQQALIVVAPLILSFLSRKRGDDNGLGGLALMLDRDGDGQLLDDIGGMLLNHIAGQSGTTSSQSAASSPSPIKSILKSFLK